MKVASKGFRFRLLVTAITVQYIAIVAPIVYKMVAVQLQQLMNVLR